MTFGIPTSVQLFGLCVWALLLCDQSRLSADETSPPPAASVILTPWKAHSMEVLKAAGESAAEPLSHAQSQYEFATRISSDPLLDYAMALVYYSHGEQKDAARLSQQAWKRITPVQPGAAKLQARLLLKQNKTSDLLQMTDELLELTLDPTVPAETRTTLADLTARIVRVLQESRISRSSDRKLLSEIEQRGQSLPDASLSQAFLDGQADVTELLTLSDDERNRRAAEKAADNQDKIGKIGDASQIAEQQKAALANQQKLSAQQLEEEVNRIDASLQNVQTLFDQRLPRWEQLRLVLPDLWNARTLLEKGFKEVLVRGVRLKPQQLVQELTATEAQYNQLDAELAQIVAAGQALIAQRTAAEARYRQVTGQIIKANQAIAGWQQKVDRQQASLVASNRKARQKKLSAGELHDLAVPINIAAEIENLKPQILALEH
ncbi:MAG: hypothetical protein R3C49_06550 [Planctomycetaceae bacterium]